jgi:hypothetical protein
VAKTPPHTFPPEIEAAARKAGVPTQVAMPGRFTREIYPSLAGIGVTDTVPGFEFESEDGELKALVFMVEGGTHEIVFLLNQEAKHALLTELAGGLHVVRG